MHLRQMKPTGSKQIHTDNNDTSTLTDRRAYAITDNKHKLVFHKDGHLLLFFTRRKASDYLKYNKCPDSWRPLRIKLNIIYDKI